MCLFQVVPLSIEMAAYDNPALQADGAGPAPAYGFASVNLDGPPDEFQVGPPAAHRRQRPERPAAPAGATGVTSLTV